MLQSISVVIIIGQTLTNSSFIDFPRVFHERDRFRPISTSANFWMLNFGTTKGGAPEGWGPKFFPSPATFFILLSLGGPFFEYSGGETPPSQINVSLRGAGVDLPECQERRRGKHKVSSISPVSSTAGTVAVDGTPSMA